VEKVVKDDSTNASSEILLMDHCSQTISSSNNLSLSKKRISVIRSTSSVDKNLNESMFLVGQMTKSSNDILSSKASFLTRDKDTLSKIANLTKSYNEADNVNGIVNNKGNFVFTALVPTVNQFETVSYKRKSDAELINEGAQKKSKNDDVSLKKI
jgi:hypothetical protein